MDRERDEDTVELIPMGGAPTPTLVTPEPTAPQTMTLTELENGQVAIIPPQMPPMVVRPPVVPGKSAVQVVVEIMLDALVKQGLRLAQPIQIFPPS